MKKVLMILGITVMLFSIVGCTKEEKGETQKKKAENQEEVSKSNATKQYVQIEKIEEHENKKFNNSDMIAVSYKESENDSNVKKGYMDLAGKIVPLSEQKYESKGGGFVFYDKNGEIQYDSNSEATKGYIMYSFNEDEYLVGLADSNIDGAKFTLGFMNSKGEWIFEPVNFSEKYPNLPAFYGEMEYLDNGIVGSYLELPDTNYLILCNSKNGKIFVINEVWNKNLKYYDSHMIYQTWNGGMSGGRKYEINSVDSDGNIIKLKEEGTELLRSCTNGFLTNENGISFYDNEGKLQWTFNDYEINYDTISLYDNYVFLSVKGKDQQEYVLCIDQQTGKLTSDPIRTGSKLLNNGVIIRYNNSDEKIYLTNVITGEDVKSLDITTSDMNNMKCLENGIFALKKKDKETEKITYRLINKNGDEIKPYIENIQE